MEIGQTYQNEEEVESWTAISDAGSSPSNMWA